MVIVVCWASAGPAVAAIKTMRPVKVELRVAMGTGTVREEA